MEIIPAFGKPKLDAEREIMFLLSSTSLKVVAWIVAVMVHSSPFFFFCYWRKPEFHGNTTKILMLFFKKSELCIKDLVPIGVFLQPKETVLFIKNCQYY